jgi:hypothetical protein
MICPLCPGQTKPCGYVECPMKEPVHYTGPHAVWCKGREAGEEFFATKFPQCVTCEECKRLLGILDVKDLKEIEADLNDWLAGRK